MKNLFLVSVFCASCAMAQDKASSQLAGPAKLFEFPTLVNPSSAAPAHTLDLSKQVAKLPGSLQWTSSLNPTGVCSVPLLDAHVDANDPGLAIKPGSGTVAIPQAAVPAPACAKNSRY